MDPIAEHYLVTDALPNWVMAIAALGALGAAIWAGLSAHKSLTELQNQSSALATAQIDGRAPVILATARAATRQDSPWVEYQELGDEYQPFAGPQADRWRAPTGDPTRVPNATPGFARTVVHIELENVSENPAVVTFARPEQVSGVFPGEVRLNRDGPPLDRSLTIGVGASIGVDWVRQVPTQSLSDTDVLMLDAYSRFTATFTVTDIGRTVEDTYHLDEPLRVFVRANGFENYLQIDQAPVDPWESTVAELQVEKRRYLRMPADARQQDRRRRRQHLEHRVQVEQASADQ